MYKRISVRLVSVLLEELKLIAKERGLSLNALISEMSCNFIDMCKKQENWDGKE